ncbi:MAG TPA: methyltransferase domain-containing protein [Terriglobales bacterium]|nr:methyltransferase domain-containing protein [Terriglobales bacterium]
MIVRVSNYSEAYGIRARYAKDVRQLAGRGDYYDVTEFVNRNIVRELELSPEDELIDIGCGDGCLLRMAKSVGLTKMCGLTASFEEAERLKHLELNIQQGLTDSLPFPDWSGSVVVCNSVLLIVPRKKISTSLKEIARVAKPGARVFIGEIPKQPELADVPRHQTVRAMLFYLLRTRGLRTFVGMLRRISFSAIKGVPIILNSAPVIEFYAEPDEFIRMAAACGLKLERFYPHRDLDEFGNVRVLNNRMDYLFRKAS